MIKKGFNGFTFSSFNPLGDMRQSQFNTPNINTQEQLISSFRPHTNFEIPITNPFKVNPQTQAEWAKQQFSNYLDKQQESFHNSLQSLTSPQEEKIDPTKYGMADAAKQFSDKAQPLIDKSNLQVRSALQSSVDLGTKLLGKIQTDDVVKKK